MDEPCLIFSPTFDHRFSSSGDFPVTFCHLPRDWRVLNMAGHLPSMKISLEKKILIEKKISRWKHIRKFL